MLGRAADAEVLLRAIESGAVKNIWIVGVLSPSPADRGQSIRGVPVLGDVDDLETVVGDLAGRGRRVARLIMTPSAMSPEARPESILVRARKLGLNVSQLPSLDSPGPAMQLAPVAVEDLLLRPSVNIDYQRLESFVTGKSVVVTGGGGSIGSEICDRLVAFGAARLLVIENSEPALHAVTEALNAKNGKAEIIGRIADVRDRNRIMSLISEFKPDFVFHAAALKHVPLLERDWDEAIKTNVFGSINVADAAAAAGAAAMVMISTDKAIEPVSMLGATKRLAEMYCQALDREFATQANGKNAMRLISVRFGNVLASNGSVVPKFKAQIEAGGPVTVTHPDMVRYFMTIREACDLVVTAATHALGAKHGDVSVYVLNMGQPVKIVDLAERLIRLSGLEPGRDIEITYHRHAPRRAAARDPVRTRGGKRGDRHSRHRRRAPGGTLAARHPRLARAARAEPRAWGTFRDLQRAARRGAGVPRRSGADAGAAHTMTLRRAYRTLPYFACALACLIVDLLYFPPRLIFPDESRFLRSAAHLVATGQFSSGGGRAWEMPGTAFFFAPAVWLFGPHDAIISIRLAQAALLVIQCGLIGLIARRLFRDAAAAFLASLIAALYPFLLFYQGLLLSETLFNTFFLAAHRRAAVVA